MRAFWGTVGIIVVAALWGLYTYVIVRMEGWPQKLETAGQFGDTFGFLTSLFTAGAAIGAIYTLAMQSRQLREAEVERHKDRFSDHFFQLLGLLRQLRTEVVYVGSKGKIYEGRRAFEEVAGEMAAYLLITSPDGKTSIEEAVQRYESESRANKSNPFGPYFRVLYNVLRRLSEDRHLSAEEKVQYGNLLRGQLGPDELVNIGFNTLSDVSADLKVYVTEFRLLKYMPESPTRTILESALGAAFESRD